jgi:hypothetical protein
MSACQHVSISAFRFKPCVFVPLLFKIRIYSCLPWLNVSMSAFQRFSFLLSAFVPCPLPTFLNFAFPLTREEILSISQTVTTLG